MQLKAQWLDIKGSTEVDLSSLVVKAIPKDMVLARPFRTFRTGKVFCRDSGEQRGREDGWLLEHLQQMVEFFYSPRSEGCPIDLEHDSFIVLGEVVGLFITAEQDGTHALWAIPAYNAEGVKIVDMGKSKNLYSSPTLSFGTSYDAATGEAITSDILHAVALTLSPAQSKNVIDKVELSTTTKTLEKTMNTKNTRKVVTPLKAKVKAYSEEKPVEEKDEEEMQDAQDCECPEGQECDCPEASESEAKASEEPVEEQLEEPVEGDESEEEAPAEEAPEAPEAEQEDLEEDAEDAPSDEDAQSPSDEASESDAQDPEAEEDCECPEGEECDCPKEEEEPAEDAKEELSSKPKRANTSLSATEQLSSLKTELSSVRKENLSLRKELFSIRMNSEIETLLIKGAITPAEVDSAKRAFTAEFSSGNPEKMVFRPFTEVYASRVTGYKVSFGTKSHGNPVKPEDTVHLAIESIAKEKKIPYHVALSEYIKTAKKS